MTLDMHVIEITLFEDMFITIICTLNRFNFGMSGPIDLVGPHTCDRYVSRRWKFWESLGCHWYLFLS